MKTGCSGRCRSAQAHLFQPGKGRYKPGAGAGMEQLKRQAAARALEEVRDGMRLGLGTGSTARHFVELLGERVAAFAAKLAGK